MSQLVQIKEAQELVTVVMGGNINLIESAQNIIIKDQDGLNIATDLLKEIKERIKSSEKKRKELVKPINDGVKAINTSFKEVSNPLEVAESLIKDKMLPVQQKLMKEERERAEAERKAREAELLAAAEIKNEVGQDDAADKLLDMAVSVKAKVNNSDIGRAGFSGAKSSITKRWTYDLIDIVELAKARPDLIEVNNVAINKAIRDGNREIRGLKIYQKETISVR